MSAEPIASGVRTVLEAPRGSRFTRTRTGARTPSREQRLLAQMEGNPRVDYRQAHGQLPHWVHLQAARKGKHQARHAPEVFEGVEGPWKPSPVPVHPQVPVIPRPRPAPDDGPAPPRPIRPPLPRRPRRPHSHRKPRRRRSRACWHLFGYTLAAGLGALAHHLTPGLL
ncbi:hypothetical protein [Nocardiopsis kunsanensis]|uniref:hypothetical protein n=1 Tax=Nocardiopsis kunsanensis TaxID=141693 RepID=UPI00034C4EBA|nr:hypothetical protein [Nocardiopsis kunsanensis]